LALGTAVWAVTEVLTAASRPLSDTFSGLLGAPVLWLGPWLLLAPERRRLLGRPPRPTVSLATVAAVPVAIGCLVWAAGNTGLAPRAFPTLFPPAEMLDDLRFDCAGLALALAVYSALAVLSRSVFPSRIVAAGSLAVAATALGWPNDLGSPGVVGGLALIAWSAVLACTRGRRRADPRAAGRSSTSLGRPSRPARPGR
jgi:hypothetical protein